MIPSNTCLAMAFAPSFWLDFKTTWDRFIAESPFDSHLLQIPKAFFWDNFFLYGRSLQNGYLYVKGANPTVYNEGDKSVDKPSYRIWCSCSGRETSDILNTMWLIATMTRPLIMCWPTSPVAVSITSQSLHWSRSINTGEERSSCPPLSYLLLLDTATEVLLGVLDGGLVGLDLTLAQEAVGGLERTL